MDWRGIWRVFSARCAQRPWVNITAASSEITRYSVERIITGTIFIDSKVSCISEDFHNIFSLSSCLQGHYYIIIIIILFLDFFPPSIFGIKCSRCGLQVSANHWIRRAGNDIYHLACFTCFFCKRQLSTGEEFGLMENQVICRLHYDIMLPNLLHMSDKGHFDSFLDV